MLVALEVAEMVKNVIPTLMEEGEIGFKSWKCNE